MVLRKFMCCNSKKLRENVVCMIFLSFGFTFTRMLIYSFIDYYRKSKYQYYFKMTPRPLNRCTSALLIRLSIIKLFRCAMHQTCLLLAHFIALIDKTNIGNKTNLPVYLLLYLWNCSPLSFSNDAVTDERKRNCHTGVRCLLATNTNQF